MFSSILFICLCIVSPFLPYLFLYMIYDDFVNQQFTVNKHQSIIWHEFEMENQYILLLYQIKSGFLKLNVFETAFKLESIVFSVTI